MPRLPIDLSTSGVRESLPNAVYSPGQATGAEFGSNVGAALQNFGDAGVSLAAKVNAYAEKEQKFDAQKGFIQAQDADSQAFEQDKRDLKGNAAGFWQGRREQTRKAMDTYLSTLPEGLRKEFSVQAESLVAARTKQAFSAQYEQADANTRLTLDEEARKSGLQVNQDPKAYSAAIDQAEKLIDASPLTDLEKTKRKAQLRNTLAYTAAQAEAQQDPASVVAAGVGGGLREKIRGKESSGDDSAKNPNSTARGRYQALESTWNGFAGAAGLPAVTDANRNTASDPRNNGALQEKFMDAYVAASTAALTSNKLPVTDANLYLLHFMGQGGGVDFLRKMNNDAGATASAAFPKQAAANTSVFYGGKDKTALSLSEVYARLTKGLNGAGTTPSAVSPVRANLTAEQTNAVDESARRALVAQQAAQTAYNDHQQKQVFDNTLVALKEGPNPDATYREARANGTISGYDNIVKAERVLADRTKGDDDLQVGIGLMRGGRGAANPFDKAHKDGIEAFYTAQTKATNDPFGSAAAVFDKTGMVPSTFATTLRGALVSDDAQKLTAGLRTVSNMLRQSPNAFAGVEGKDQIEKAASEYERLTTKLNMPEADAVQRIQADARAPDNMDPIKSEQLQAFKKSYLSQEKIDSRISSQLGSWYPGGGATLPTGAARTAIGSIYSDLADEGYRQTRDPDKALAFADYRMKQQFGVQNGVVTRYPPEKAGLPAVEGKGYGWVNEQAAQTVKDQLNLVVDPSQITFMPIERDGVSTSAAFRDGRRTTVKRDDSRPGQQSTFDSVPYQILVMPKDEKGEVQVLNGAFFPDIEGYLAGKNAEQQERAGRPKGAQMYDLNGVPYDAPAYAPELMQSTEQVARRKRAEDLERLAASPEQERTRRAEQQERLRPPAAVVRPR